MRINGNKKDTYTVDEEFIIKVPKELFFNDDLTLQETNIICSLPQWIKTNMKLKIKNKTSTFYCLFSTLFLYHKR